MGVTYDDTMGAAPITGTITREVTPFRVGQKSRRKVNGLNSPFTSGKGAKNGATRNGVDCTVAGVLTTEQDLVLKGFDLDLTSGVKQLKLYFNKEVSPATLDVTKITIQDAATAGLSHTLSDSFTTATTPKMILTIDLGSTDYSALTETVGLADSQAHTWITLVANMIEDLSEVGSGAIPDGSGIQVHTFTI